MKSPRRSNVERWSLLVALLFGIGFALPVRLEASNCVRIQKTVSLKYSQLSPADVATLVQAGVTVLDDYGPFATGLANDGIDLSTAGASLGVTIIAEPDAYRIDGGATHIDIRSPEKALFGVPPDLQLADYPGAVGLYLVKFRGPMRPGWMDPLTKAGVRFIQYVHKNAYIVAASGGLSRLQSLVTGPVIFAGVYQPYYKLAAELRSADAMAAVAPGTIRVMLDRGQDLQDVTAQIRAVDGAASVHVPVGVEDAGATFVASAAEWRRLAAHPAVIAIEPWLGGSASDERVDQVIAVHRNGDLPTQAQQYKIWLSGLCGGACGDLSGEIVDVMDSGIATYHADLPASRIPSYKLYFGINYLNDDYWHGTVVSALIAGDPSQAGGSGRTDADGFYYDMGVAPTVKIHPSRWLTATGNPPIGYTLDAGALDTIVGAAWNDNARFQNFSWNENTNSYTLLAREYDLLVRDATRSGTPDRPITVVVAAANDFDHSDPSNPGLNVRSPATAKNVIAVGATGIQRGPAFGGDMGFADCNSDRGIRDIAYFSLQGVAQNFNRFKPDIYAPGDTVSSARSTSGGGFPWCARNIQPPPPHMPPLPPPDGPNTPANGTSFSTPVVTGTAVLAKKKILSDRVDHFCEMPLHPDPCPTPAMIKAAILSTTETNSGGHNWCRRYRRRISTRTMA